MIAVQSLGGSWDQLLNIWVIDWSSLEGFLSSRGYFDPLKKVVWVLLP